jgi:RNA polymerase sigma-70 factor (family 1)
MSDLLASYENILLKRLKDSDQSAFTIIFTKYYEDLVRFSFHFTRNSDTSEEIVQEVFLKLWENRDSLVIHNSLKSFLLKAVQNRSIDNLRHLKIIDKYNLLILDHPLLSENDTENYVLLSELEENLNQAMAKLPVQMAQAFRMSRIENLNYSEIAAKLGVSIRTVEVWISKALSILRKELKDFLLLLLLFYKVLH